VAAYVAGDALRLAAATVIALALIVAGYNGWQILRLSVGRGGGAAAGGGGCRRRCFVLDALFSLALVGGARIAARLMYEESRPVAAGGIVRLLIIGAGDAAAAVLREIARMPEQRYRVVGCWMMIRRRPGSGYRGWRCWGRCLACRGYAASSRLARS